MAQLWAVVIEVFGRRRRRNHGRILTLLLLLNRLELLWLMLLVWHSTVSVDFLGNPVDVVVVDGIGSAQSDQLTAFLLWNDKGLGTRRLLRHLRDLRWKLRRIRGAVAVWRHLRSWKVKSRGIRLRVVDGGRLGSWGNKNIAMIALAFF